MLAAILYILGGIALSLALGIMTGAFIKEGKGPDDIAY